MIVETRTTHATPEEIWSLLGDLTHWADILPTVEQVTRLSPAGPIAVGDRYEIRQPGLPKAVYEITDWQPGRAFTWVSRAPGVRTRATHRLEPSDDGTRLELGIEWTGAVAWLIRLLVGAKTRRFVEQEADVFVRLAEHAR